MKKTKISALLFSALTAISALSAPASAEPEPTATTSIRVLCLGDSITDGFWYDGGYRIELCRLLESNGLNTAVDFVGPNSKGECYDNANAGYTGFSINKITPDQCPTMDNRHGLSEYIDGIMTDYPADIVCMQIGTNDVLSAYAPDGFEARLEALVDTVLGYLEQNGGTLFLATLTPMDASDTTYIKPEFFTVESMDGFVADCNASIRNIVDKKQQAGAKIALCDWDGIITKADLYDGVHPSEQGYAKMGAKWFDFIKGYIDEKNTPPEETAAVSAPAVESKSSGDTILPTAIAAAAAIVLAVGIIAVIIFRKRKNPEE